MKNIFATLSLTLMVFTALYAVSVNDAVAFGTSGSGGCCGGGGDPGQTTGPALDPGPTPTPNPNPNPKPAVCQYLKANGQTGSLTLPPGATSVDLTWASSLATGATLTPTGSSVTVNGGNTVTVTGDTRYTFNVTNLDGVSSCFVDVFVQATQALTCTDIVFNSDNYVLPRGGGSVTLSWATTGIDSLSINGVTSTNLSGSELVSLGSNTTYTLTAIAGSKTIQCPLTIKVATGGGGGGSSRPRCNLDISDKKITLGDSVTLTWDTTRSKEVKITDNHGNVLLESTKKDDRDGEMTIKPTKDTEYTLLSKRGSKDRTCTVGVEITNNITVFETRTHDPRVAGISLTQVPYTGFESGPTLTLIFYVLLTIWGLFVAYVFVMRRDSIGGVSLAGSHDHVSFTDVRTDANPLTEEPIAEKYVASTITSTDAPSNLPIATPVIGYAAVQNAMSIETSEKVTGMAEMTDVEVDASIEMTELENRAHAQHVLISSDAMRFFINATEAGDTRNAKLDTTIGKAKATIPSDDGWLVLNLARIETLISDEQATSEVKNETKAITGGSLAEALITGNIVAAYAMIKNRPMIALADAAADLDAVYRSRKGETVQISDLLITSTKTLSTQQLEASITALTGALDGTYDSEEAAVKMAIMKAVKAVA